MMGDSALWWGFLSQGHGIFRRGRIILKMCVTHCLPNMLSYSFRVGMKTGGAEQFW